MSSKNSFISRLNPRVQRVLAWLHKELHEEGAYLVPLRLFIGIGWMRASIEKLIESDWYDGTALVHFLNDQLAEGIVRFPFYRSLINNVFIPNAQILAWIIIIGQMLTGLSILTGTFTNLGLQTGLFMNFNFVLAGAVNPSAFYIVIQLVLFIGNTGSIVGVDSFLDKYVPYSFLVAQNDYKRRFIQAEKITFLIMGFGGFVLAGFALFYVQDFSPNSVDDPAMLLFILGQLGGMALFIDYFRLQSPDIEPPKISSPHDIIFTHGEVGKYITWKLEDTNPDTYVIMENHTNVLEKSWQSGDTIIYPVDHLEIGHHRIVITARDWFNNTNSDAVTVTVLDPLVAETSKTVQLLQYFREMLIDQETNLQQSLRIVIDQIQNLKTAMTNMNDQTKVQIRDKYDDELDRLYQRKSYIEQSIEHTSNLLNNIDEEQGNKVHTEQKKSAPPSVDKNSADE